MEKITSVLQCIVPIFVTVFLGVLARRKQLMKQEEIRGLQQFVMKIGLPCVIFNTFSQRFTVDYLRDKYMLLIASTVLLILLIQ